MDSNEKRGGARRAFFQSEVPLLLIIKAVRLRRAFRVFLGICKQCCLRPGSGRHPVAFSRAVPTSTDVKKPQLLGRVHMDPPLRGPVSGTLPNYSKLFATATWCADGPHETQLCSAKLRTFAQPRSSLALAQNVRMGLFTPRDRMMTESRLLLMIVSSSVLFHYLIFITPHASTYDIAIYYTT